MARLNNNAIESDDELPDLSSLLGAPGKPLNKPLETSPKKQAEGKSSPEKRPVRRQNTVDNDISDDVRECSSGEKSPRKQRPLTTSKPSALNAQPPPIASKGSHITTETDHPKSSIRSSPRKVKAKIDYSRYVPRLSDGESSFLESDDSFTDLSGFIVPDSASDDDDLSPPAKGGSRDNGVRGSSRKPKPQSGRNSSFEFQLSSFGEKEDTGPIDLTSPKKGKELPKSIRFTIPPRFRSPPTSSGNLDDSFSKLQISAPAVDRAYCTGNESRPVTPPSRPVTPPSSPSKSKLQSPSKRHRIPPSPHRPSIDAFWSADVINDWNEQYSPKNIITSPRKNRLHSVHEVDDELSPSESPRKTLSQSPTKKNKQAIEQRKAFNARKNDMAVSFLSEVDSEIGDGQVSAMAASTGGIRIVWSKKLSCTAGRANWRREAVRSKNSDGSTSTTTHRHHASIELAEKVIDDEDRLINVIAHEYCHLANFMISGIKDQPHGASFKSWAAKTTQAFSHRNINVTTKHTYEIVYKYIWICSSEHCGSEYKRHSKSIDPEKHRCGSCKARLVQIKPVPRKGEKTDKRSEYQQFVKREYERVRSENPGKGFGDVMVVLGREFRVWKMGSDGERNIKEGCRASSSGNEKFDDVVRKLEFLKV